MPQARMGARMKPMGHRAVRLLVINVTLGVGEGGFLLLWTRMDVLLICVCRCRQVPSIKPLAAVQCPVIFMLTRYVPVVGNVAI